MPFFSDLGTNISSKSKEVAKKARDMADIASMTTQINSQERLIDRAYLEIGKMYFADNKNNTSLPYDEKMNLVRGYMDKIEMLKASINMIKQSDAPIEKANNVQTYNLKEEINEIDTSQSKTCPNCGEAVSSDMKFCLFCGQKL